jgi:hypothetical protein
LVFEKNDNFRQKLAKIAEKCDNQSNQPLLAGGLTSGVKQRAISVCLFHVASVLMVKQQDGD